MQIIFPVKSAYVQNISIGDTELCLQCHVIAYLSGM